MATKKISQVVTLNLEAGNAGMVDLGKMLGPTGVNMRAVKSDYDAATAAQRGEIVPVVVTVYEDRSYTLRYKTHPPPGSSAAPSAWTRAPRRPAAGRWRR